MKYALLYLCSALVFVSCQNVVQDSRESERISPAPQVSRTYGPRPPASLPELPADPDATLGTTCRIAGGAYLPGRHLCQCPDEKVFTLGLDPLSQEPEGKCQSLQDVPVDPNEPFFCKKTTDPFARVCVFGQDPESERGLEETWEKIRQSGGSLVFPSISSLKIQSTWVSTASDLERFFLTYFGEFALNQIETPSEIALSHTGATAFFLSQVYYEPEAERIPELMQGLRPSDAEFRLKLPEARETQADPSLLDSMQKALRLVQAGSSATETWDQYEPRSVLGCAEYCSFRKFWNFVQGRSIRVTWEKSYASGSVFRNVLIFQREDGTVEAQVILTPADTASLIFFYGYEFQGEKLARVARAFDRLGAKVHEERTEWAMPQERGRDMHPGSGSVVVCEEGFPVGAKAEEAGLADRLAVGPYEQESFWGWVRNPERSLIIRWSGLGRGMIAPGLPFYASEEHATKVSKTLTESNDLRVIPIGVDECMNRPESWKESVAAKSVKVVNLSSVFSYDHASCVRSEIGKTILASPFLWVAGAGNGSERTNVAQSRGCPADLGPLSNLIVVAASSGPRGGVGELSTYGQEFADILADGTCAGGSPGRAATSCAAPHVSAFAAQLAELYPELSVPAIRLSILAGAYVPHTFMNADRNSFAETRSGGWLDPSVSTRIARGLANHLSWASLIQGEQELSSFESFLKSAHCEGFRFSKLSDCNRRVEERLERLIQTGVVNYAR